MRLQKFLLNEEDIISQALAIGEPEVGGEYTDDEVSRKLTILNKAIDVQASKVDSLEGGEQYDSSLSILKDLKDKLSKWNNWEEETKSAGPNPPPAMGTEEEEEDEPEEEEKDK